MVVVEKGNNFPFCCWYWFLCNSIGLLLVKFVYRRVAEFTEYGDMSMIMQYLKDVQAVQKKTTELTEAIEFINMVHFLVNILLFKAWLLEVNIVRKFLTGDTVLPCKTMIKYDIEFSRWCFLLILTEYEQITNLYSPWNNQKTIGFLMYRILRKKFLKRKLTFFTINIHLIDIQEEDLFKWEQTTYPDVDYINVAIEPYQKLFSAVVKWQRSEKKWMDGAFLELDAETTEAEVSLSFFCCCCFYSFFSLSRESDTRESFFISNIFISNIKLKLIKN